MSPTIILSQIIYKHKRSERESNTAEESNNNKDSNNANLTDIFPCIFSTVEAKKLTQLILVCGKIMQINLFASGCEDWKTQLQYNMTAYLYTELKLIEIYSY